MFDAKMIRWPSGWKNGAKLDPPFVRVTWRRPVPSRFITKISRAIGRHKPSLSSAR